MIFNYIALAYFLGTTFSASVGEVKGPELWKLYTGGQSKPAKFPENLPEPDAMKKMFEKKTPQYTRASTTTMDPPGIHASSDSATEPQLADTNHKATRQVPWADRWKGQYTNWGKTGTPKENYEIPAKIKDEKYKTMYESFADFYFPGALDSTAPQPSDKASKIASIKASSGEIYGGSVTDPEMNSISLFALEMVLDMAMTFLNSLPDKCLENTGVPHNPKDASTPRPCLKWFDLTLSDINNFITLPMTIGYKTSFATLMKQVKIQDIPLGGQTTWFVSHVWSNKFVRTVQGLRQHCMSVGCNPYKTYYWICAFANSQWNFQMPTETKDTPFYNALTAKTTQGILAVQNDKSDQEHHDQSTLTFTRVWCAFEMAIAIEKDIPIVMICGPEETEAAPYTASFPSHVIPLMTGATMKGKCGKKAVALMSAFTWEKDLGVSSLKDAVDVSGFIETTLAAKCPITTVDATSSEVKLKGPGTQGEKPVTKGKGLKCYDAFFQNFAKGTLTDTYAAAIKTKWTEITKDVLDPKKSPWYEMQADEPIAQFWRPWVNFDAAGGKTVAGPAHDGKAVGHLRAEVQLKEANPGVESDEVKIGNALNDISFRPEYAVLSVILIAIYFGVRSQPKVDEAETRLLETEV